MRRVYTSLPTALYGLLYIFVLAWYSGEVYLDNVENTWLHTLVLCLESVMQVGLYLFGPVELPKHFSDCVAMLLCVSNLFLFFTIMNSFGRCLWCVLILGGLLV